MAQGALSQRVSTPVVLTIGAGGGMALATAVLQLLHPTAAPIAQAVLQWGPLFVLSLIVLLLGYHLVETWAPKCVDAFATNAAAMQSMAEAMQRISNRQDEKDRERELALDHLAATTQRILTKLEAMEERQTAFDALSRTRSATGGAQ